MPRRPSLGSSFTTFQCRDCLFANNSIHTIHAHQVGHPTCQVGSMHGWSSLDYGWYILSIETVKKLLAGPSTAVPPRPRFIKPGGYVEPRNEKGELLLIPTNQEELKWSQKPRLCSDTTKKATTTDNMTKKDQIDIRK